jgi:hypothetical protein
LKKRRIVTRIDWEVARTVQFLYLLPILSFVGGGIALSMPAAAAPQKQSRARTAVIADAGLPA